MNRLGKYTNEEYLDQLEIWLRSNNRDMTLQAEFISEKSKRKLQQEYLNRCWAVFATLTNEDL